MAANEGRKIGKFFREIRAEMRKVTWPTRSEILTYTEVVLIVMILFTILVFLADSAFSALLKLIIKG